MSNGPIEPTAISRAAAKELHDIFVALVNEGFSDQQALVIVGQIIAAQILGGSS